MARQMTSRSAGAVYLTLALALGIPAADATVLLHVPFEEQAQTARRIVVGEVGSVTSRRSAARPAYFETLVTLTVERVVAGSAPATLELRFSGGQVGDLRQSIDGMPTFAAGERYVVFLHPEQDPPLISPVVGFNQGLYRVVADAAGREIVRDHLGRPLEASSGTAGRAAATTTDPGLDAFIAAVEAVRR